VCLWRAFLSALFSGTRSGGAPSEGAPMMGERFRWRCQGGEEKRLRGRRLVVGEGGAEEDEARACVLAHLGRGRR